MVALGAMAAAWCIAEGWDAANNPARFDPSFIYDALKLPLFGRAKHASSPPTGAYKSVGAKSSLPAPTLDDYGRPKESECRDVNPATMHILLTNMLGLHDSAVVADRNAGSEVWNQPIQGFDVTNAQNGKLREISKADALKLLEADVSWSSAMPSTSMRPGEFKVDHFSVPRAGTLTVRMTGSGDADLYLRRTTAPTSSAFDARSDRREAVPECHLEVRSGETVYWSLRARGAVSGIGLLSGISSPSAPYIFNPSAVKFFHVKTRVSYGVFAHKPTPELPGKGPQPQPARQTPAIDNYEYVLEADANGKLIGGEWVGESKKKHPDYMWVGGD